MAAQKTTATTRDENTLSGELHSMCNLEGITLIWYDANLNVTTREKLKLTKKHLRPINNYVIFEKEEQSCIDVITSIKNEKILFITSGSQADHILSLDDKCVYNLVHTVFIFCWEKDNYEDLSKQYPKINGIYTDSEELKTAIKNKVDLIQMHFEIFNIYEKNEQNSIRDLTQEKAPFIWLSVFKEIVVLMPKDKKAKNEMIDTCTRYYDHNKTELDNIKEFIREYKPDKAIVWYTKCSFVYKLVNKALRIGDVEQLYVFRFYISDLCEEINKRHKQITERRSWLFYRGARLPLKEVEKLKQSEGKLIATNGFLSTSLSREIAEDFALTITPTDTEESVIFEIECDHESATFAFIDKVSDHPEEKEVLFDLGTTFDVLSVTDTQDEEEKVNIWVVKLRSTQEGKKMGQQFVKSFTEVLEGEYRLHVEVFWGHLLSQMGEFEKSVKYFQKLLNTPPTNVPVEMIHWKMTDPLVSLGRLDEVLEHLKLCQKNFHKCGTDPWNFYTFFGYVYYLKGQYNRTIKEYTTALQIAIKQVGNYHLDTVEIYRFLGTAYISAGQYQSALVTLNNAVRIYQQYHPRADVALSKALGSIGEVHRLKGEFQQAVQYYTKILDILNRDSVMHIPDIFYGAIILYKAGLVMGELSVVNLSLQGFHNALRMKQEGSRGLNISKNIVQSFSAIGAVHIVKGEFEISLKFFEDALHLALPLYGINNAEVADLYYDKGIALECLGRNDEALTAFETALDIQNKLFLEGHRSLACTLCSVGNQCRIKKDLSLARICCDEALAMQKLILPPDDFETCLPLYHIGLILYDQETMGKVCRI